MNDPVVDEFGGVPVRGPCHRYGCAASGLRRRYWRLGPKAYIELCDEHAKEVAWPRWVWNVALEKAFTWRTLALLLLVVSVVEAVMIVRGGMSR